MNLDNGLLKCLSFDFPKVNKKIQNTMCVIISCYITCIWVNRDDPSFLVNKFKAKIIKTQKTHMKILKDKAIRIFSENYCNMQIQILNNL